MKFLNRQVRECRDTKSNLAVWILGFVVALAVPSSYSAPWKFVFFADTQAADWNPMINTNSLAEISRAVAREQPAFLLFGGDIANHPSPDAPPAWTNIASPVYEAGIPVYATVGNHDFWGIPDFIKAFGATLPDNGPPGEVDQTYAFSYSNVLIVCPSAFTQNGYYMLNQAWIDEVLKTNTLAHVIAMSHPAAFPVYHQPSECLARYPEARDRFWHSLRNAGARIYFSGHDHFYDHSRIDDGDGNPDNDIHQIVSGTGGAFLYPDFWDRWHGDNGTATNGIWKPLRVMHDQSTGYVLVEVDGARLTATWKRRVAPDTFEPMDSFTYTAAPRAPKLNVKLAPTGPSESRTLTLDWGTQGLLQMSDHVHGPYTNVTGAVAPYTVTNLAQQRMFFRVVSDAPATPK